MLTNCCISEQVDPCGEPVIIQLNITKYDWIFKYKLHTNNSSKPRNVLYQSNIRDLIF